MRCVRLWTDQEGLSEFEEGTLVLKSGKNESLLSEKMQATTSFFEETAATGKPTWHTAPNRQLVVTLGGTLDFKTPDGRQFTIRSGDIILAEDTTGSGHGWHIVGNDPWRRVYVVLDSTAVVPFRANQREQ